MKKTEFISFQKTDPRMDDIDWDWHDYRLKLENHVYISTSHSKVFLRNIEFC